MKAVTRRVTAFIKKMSNYPKRVCLCVSPGGQNRVSPDFRPSLMSAIMSAAQKEKLPKITDDHWLALTRSGLQGISCPQHQYVLARTKRLRLSHEAMTHIL